MRRLQQRFMGRPAQPTQPTIDSMQAEFTELAACYHASLDVWVHQSRFSGVEGGVCKALVAKWVSTLLNGGRHIDFGRAINRDIRTVVDAQRRYSTNLDNANVSEEAQTKSLLLSNLTLQAHQRSASGAASQIRQGYLDQWSQMSDPTEAQQMADIQCLLDPDYRRHRDEADQYQDLTQGTFASKQQLEDNILTYSWGRDDFPNHTIKQLCAINLANFKAAGQQLLDNIGLHSRFYLMRMFTKDNKDGHRLGMTFNPGGTESVSYFDPNSAVFDGLSREQFPDFFAEHMTKLYGDHYLNGKIVFLSVS